MFGSTIGTLRIHLGNVNATNRTTLWELRGQQSTNQIDWKQGVVPIQNTKEDYTVIIEGTIGQSVNTGDIA
jgi:hypothetical protein